MKKSTWTRLKKFIWEDLWRLDFTELTRTRKSFFKALQIFLLIGRGSIQNKVLLRASALTFSSLLALVPFFALAFSILKGMGVPQRLEPYVLTKLTAGSEVLVSQLLSYIDRVNARSLGAVGLIILIVTIVMVLGNIEGAFNDIWGIRTSRPWLRKFSDYLSLIFIMPIFFFAALSITASLKSTTLMGWIHHQPTIGSIFIFMLQWLPYLLLWGIFTFLFLFIPNTRVRFQSALLAGCFTGLFWQISQWGYVSFQVGVSRYHEIYGAFAQVPIMFVWLYFSWIIVLLGAELCFALQNVETYQQERQSEAVNLLSRYELSIAFLSEIEATFRKGLQPHHAEELAQLSHISIRLARSILNDLVQVGFLKKIIEKNQHYYLPAYQLTNLPVHCVIEKLEEKGMTISKHPSGIPLLKRNFIGKQNEKELLQDAVLGRRKSLRKKDVGAY